MRVQTFIALSLCLALASAATLTERFSGPAYLAQSGQEKLAQLWKEITADKTPLGWYSIPTQLLIFIESMKPTFDTYSDTFPPGRKLLTHTVGAVAQVEFIAEKGHPYTGVFQGASNALLRFATATQSKPDGEPFGNFNPALAFKVLRDNVPSANILAMYTADGQKSWNPFSCDWSNHIPAPVTDLVKKLDGKFKSVTPYTGRLGISDVARFNEKGEEATNVKVPFRVIFSPTTEVSKKFPDTFDDLLYEQMKTIPVGTNIYDVLAIEKPYGPAVKIGTIKSKSEFTTSKFGDKELFFRHQFVEEDLKLNPDWKTGMQVDPPIPYTRA